MASLYRLNNLTPYVSCENHFLKNVPGLNHTSLERGPYLLLIMCINAGLFFIFKPF